MPPGFCLGSDPSTSPMEDRSPGLKIYLDSGSLTIHIIEADVLFPRVGEYAQMATIERQGQRIYLLRWIYGSRDGWDWRQNDLEGFQFPKQIFSGILHLILADCSYSKVVQRF
jgi:hypothetical protein